MSDQDRKCVSGQNVLLSELNTRCFEPCENKYMAIKPMVTANLHVWQCQQPQYINHSFN